MVAKGDMANPVVKILCKLLCVFEAEDVMINDLLNFLALADIRDCNF